MQPIATKGAPIAQSVEVTNADTPSTKPVWGDDAGVFIKHGDAKNVIKVDYNLPSSIAAPIKAGQQIGTANVTEGGKPVTTIALLAPSDVPRTTSLTKRLLSIF